jgi:hypothetical protein
MCWLSEQMEKLGLKDRQTNIGKLEIHCIEECAELIQAISKAQRFGYFNWHPDRPKRTNYDDILTEMDDVEKAIGNLKVYLQASYDKYVLK